MTHILVALVISAVTLMSLCMLTCDGFHAHVIHRSRRSTADDSTTSHGSKSTQSKHSHSRSSATSKSSSMDSSFWNKLLNNTHSHTDRKPNTIHAFQQQDIQTDEVEVEQVILADDGVRYGVLLDAGSSSTKFKVYNYTPGRPPTMVPHVQLEVSVREKPGLNHFVSHPERLKDYLSRILVHAAAKVPLHLHSSTPVYVMATAGLRTLPVSSAKTLLANVREVLNNASINPFSFKDDHVNILAGEEEAVYAWLAANYLHGFFSSNMTREDSIGVLEMGGGSMQIAFLPDGPLYQEEFQVYLGRRRFDLYAQTYLSFGSNYITTQVRRVLLQGGEFLVGKHLYSPCMLADDSSKFQLDKTAYKVNGTGNAQQCEEVLAQILKPDDSALCSPGPCAIGNTYQPAVGALKFVAISAFRYAPKSLDAVGPDGTLNITKLRHNAWNYCKLTVPEAVSLTGTRPQFASNDCLMGLYIPLLLTRSLGFAEDTDNIAVVKYIKGRDIDWALGAMIQQLSMAFMDDLDGTISCRKRENSSLANGTRASTNPSSGSRVTATTLTLLLNLLLALKLTSCHQLSRLNYDIAL